jgi:hypothetical protein
LVEKLVWKIVAEKKIFETSIEDGFGINVSYLLLEWDKEPLVLSLA